MSLSPTLLSTVFAALLLSLMPACAVNADMFGLFAKKYDVHLSPAVSGRLTKDGKPLAGVEVVRVLHYGEPFTDKVINDANGAFQLVERNIRSSLPGGLFSGDTKVIQSIMAVHQGKEYAIWYTSQIGITPNQGLTKRLAQLDCDLASEEANFYFKARETELQSHTVISICRWPFGPKPNDLDDDWSDHVDDAGTQLQ